MIEALVLVLFKISVSLSTLPCFPSSHQWNDSDKVSQHLLILIFLFFIMTSCMCSVNKGKIKQCEQSTWFVVWILERLCCHGIKAWKIFSKENVTKLTEHVLSHIKCYNQWNQFIHIFYFVTLINPLQQLGN